ncbi:hypothetical protein [Levilactobacillus fuyuanensis]|uniref:Uncharacterized protein n=1 Tax=Levilactobacillus fuyuanensis TaxID=2486022 RepID=A0ABW4H2Z6_9LACO|nr:hypothetical protein [Levilactobacillus fuyuanensis]
MRMVQQNTTAQYLLFGSTLILMGLTIVLFKPVALAVIGFLSLVTLTFHFDLFASTHDRHFLNEADFILQLVLVVIVLTKLFLVARPHLV